MAVASASFAVGVAARKPFPRELIIGWEALRQHCSQTLALFARVDARLSQQAIHSNSDLAWEMGLETGTLTFTDGRESPIDFPVTHVDERHDGR